MEDNMKLRNKKMTTLLFSMMLVLSMALATTGCGSSNQKNDNQVSTEAQNTEDQNAVVSGTEGGASDEAQVTVLGEGAQQFTFTVVDKDGNEAIFEIHTDKETVGAALLDLGLIAGDEGDYGLYVKTVNGITADYDVDQTYWAFYINGEYAMTGVDATTVEAGATYSFKVEK